MRPDTLVAMPGALLQHGPASDRVYLMKLESGNVPGVIRFMEQLADHNGYSKLFAKVPQHAAGWFAGQGYTVEARVPDLYPEGADGLFMAKYPRKNRAILRNPETVRQVLETAREQHPSPPREVPQGWTMHVMDTDDTREMSALYRRVFETYPFPIFDPDYLCSTMRSHVRYFGVRDEAGTLMALASAEMDPPGKNAEMTDFATLPTCRGKGLARSLLSRMEHDMTKSGLRTAFTIARAHEPGINIVFARAGYAFAGTLPNNTQIKGGLESMNVWSKSLV